MGEPALFKVIDEPGFLWIDNGLVGLDFAKSKGGNLSLRSIVNLVTGANFQLHSKPGEAWWEMEWRDGEGFKAVVASTSPAACSYRIQKGAAEDELFLTVESRSISLNAARYGREGGGDKASDERVDVTTTLRLRADEPFVAFSSSMRYEGDQYTLWRWTLPVMTNLHRAGASRTDDRLTMPTGWGSYISEPAKIGNTPSTFPGRGGYPSHRWTMQFLAFDNQKHGLYLGVHDPKARPKMFNVNAYPPHRRYPDPPPSGNLFISVDHLPEGMGEVPSEARVEHVVIGVFDGDWYDAAQIYRKWAVEQKWIQKGNVAERTDIPEAFKKIGLWWCLSSGKDTGTLTTSHEVSTQEVGELALRLKEKFPHPTGVHWYNWHHNPFNTSFPDYLPAREGFAMQVERLAKESITVMPYINARLADPNSDSWHDDGMERFSVKWASPRLKPKGYYMPAEQYAGEQWLFPMCAATPYWQGKVAALVERIRNELGVEAVYLDQIAAGMPPVCFDPSHGHSLGGGAYAVEGYTDLLERILDENKEQGIALTTECNAEPFLGGVAAFLMWMSIDRSLVPLFPTVYGGKVITYGRRYTEDDLTDPNAFYLKTGQIFTWGCQAGWIANAVAAKLLDVAYEEQATYLNRVVTAYSAGRAYLQEGRLLRTPKALLPLKELVAEWSRPNQRVPGVSLPEVLCELWLHPNGKAALAVTNMSDTSRTVRYCIEDPEAGLDGQAYSLRPLSPECVVQGAAKREEVGLVVDLTLLPRSAAVIEFVEA